MNPASGTIHTNSLERSQVFWQNLIKAAKSSFHVHLLSSATPESVITIRYKTLHVKAWEQGPCAIPFCLTSGWLSMCTWDYRCMRVHTMPKQLQRGRSKHAQVQVHLHKCVTSMSTCYKYEHLQVILQVLCYSPNKKNLP